MILCSTDTDSFLLSILLHKIQASIVQQGLAVVARIPAFGRGRLLQKARPRHRGV
jgi:hypothetical protein